MKRMGFLRALRRVIRVLAHQKTPFLILPPLMMVLVAGTVAQRYMGLYEAERLFFSSFIIWAGPVPLPGGYTLMALLTVSLLLKFLFYSPWSLPRAGTILAHLGILVLCLGGFFTAISAQEGSLIIPEGESGRTVLDDHQRMLEIAQGNEIVMRIPHQDLRPGAIFMPGDGTGSLEVLSACRDCRIEKRADDGAYKGMARFMALTPQKSGGQDEENLYGVTFRLKDFSPEEDGIYIAFDVMPEPLLIGKTSLLYGREKRNLPFSLKLKDFRQENHPGTVMASNYSSDLVVQDGGMEWPVTVTMNAPLRYRGYTFFQSSFAPPDPESERQESTMLAVVYNRAWLFPYIGTGIMAAGLLLHFILSVRGRKS